jgi:hypothetical protein
LFENRVLREIFGPKKEEKGRRLDKLYTSPNIKRVIKSGRMR